MTASASHSRDHGGRIDAAIAQYGGSRSTWVDLSTGIAPFSYPLPDLTPEDWTALPDQGAEAKLIAAARSFWNVPDGAEILPVAGASVAIAQIPRLFDPADVLIKGPTYNEHAAAFALQGWTVRTEGTASAKVIVHPNNPTGAIRSVSDLTDGLCVVDESFCDTLPHDSLVPHLTDRPNLIVLKSFGKFWGLAGVRLGFVIGTADHINRLRDWIGPWAVSGPALRIGAAALGDPAWADAQRARLDRAARDLDALFVPKHATCVGGTTLFRLYETPDAQALHHRLAEQHILTRVFPYNDHWLRVGLPPDAGWAQLKAAL